MYSISQLSRKDSLSEKYIHSLPGPNKYNPNNEAVLSKSLVAEFPKSKSKFKTNLSEKLGPGCYYIPPMFGREGPKVNILQVTNKFSVSHSKKRDIVQVGDNPGPAAYQTDNINFIKEKGPIYKIVNANDKEASKLKNDNPGPGTYNIGSLVLGPHHS